MYKVNHYVRGAGRSARPRGCWGDPCAALASAFLGVGRTCGAAEDEDFLPEGVARTGFVLVMRRVVRGACVQGFGFKGWIVEGSWTLVPLTTRRLRWGFRV